MVEIYYSFLVDKEIGFGQGEVRIFSFEGCYCESWFFLGIMIWRFMLEFMYQFFYLRIYSFEQQVEFSSLEVLVCLVGIVRMCLEYYEVGILKNVFFNNLIFNM